MDRLPSEILVLIGEYLLRGWHEEARKNAKSVASIAAANKLIDFLMLYRTSSQTASSLSLPHGAIRYLHLHLFEDYNPSGCPRDRARHTEVLRFLLDNHRLGSDHWWTVAVAKALRSGFKDGAALILSDSRLMPRLSVCYIFFFVAVRHKDLCTTFLRVFKDHPDLNAHSEWMVRNIIMYHFKMCGDEPDTLSTDNGMELLAKFLAIPSVQRPIVINSVEYLETRILSHWRLFEFLYLDPAFEMEVNAKKRLIEAAVKAGNEKMIRAMRKDIERFVSSSMLENMQDKQSRPKIVQLLTEILDLKDQDLERLKSKGLRVNHNSAK